MRTLKLSLADIDARIVAHAGTLDDLALLWLYKAELLAVAVNEDTLRLVLGIGADEVRDVFARVSERGLAERVA